MYNTVRTDNTVNTECEGGMHMPKLFTGKREVYLEIADRYGSYIQAGVLKDGDRLPSVRTVAGELGVNPNTVQRAYTHLEEQGLICTLPKKGVFVTVPSKRNMEQNQIVLETIQLLKKSGYKKEELISALEEVYGND